LVKFQTRLNIQNFVASLISYPFESLEKKEIGVLIGEIKLMASEQQDSVYICNSISKSIDSKFLNALRITLANYRSELQLISEEDKISFYVIYKVENNEFAISYKRIPEKLVGPLKMTLHDKIRSSNPKMQDKIIKIKPDLYYWDNIAERRLKIKSLESSNKDVSLIKQKLNRRSISRKEKQIIENLNELIRRNPFNPELFKQRAELHRKHNDLIKAKKDILFIKYYIKKTDS